MTLDSYGMLTGEVMQVYHSALTYLKKTGFDFKEVTPGKIAITVLPIDKNLFTSTNPDDWILPIPYKVNNDVISKVFMDAHKLRKEIDLRRHLRVIAIILVRFSGPKESDILSSLKSRLQTHFIFNDRGYQEEAIIRALHVYEQFSGKRSQCHKTLAKKDYIAFARILNNLFLIYNTYEKKELTITFLMDIHRKLLKYLEKPQTRTMLFDRLNYYNIIDIKSEDELIQMVDSPTERVKMIKKIKDWVSKQQADPTAKYKMAFKYRYGKLNVAELLKIIEISSDLDALVCFLNELGIDNSDIYAFKKLMDEPKNRLALVNKIVTYCEKIPFE